jgi:hypothetical protein
MSNGVWQRMRFGLRTWGARLQSLLAGAHDVVTPGLPPRGAQDVRSNDLGDRTAWLQRGLTYTRFDEIQEAIVTDALLLRASFLPEQLAKQGGISLEPPKGDNLSERKKKRALREVEQFLGNVVSPFGEGYEEIFYRSVGELGRFSNFAIEKIYEGNQLANLSLLPWLGMNLAVSETGLPVGWVQFDYYLKRRVFELWEICHGVLNRQAGDRYGTPGLEPTSGSNGDLQAFRSTEALAGEQLQHMIFPTRLIKFGTEQYPETNDSRLQAQKEAVEDMYREGYLIGSGRESLHSDAPNPMDPTPQLKYWKQRVAQATGYSLVRLGEGDEVNVATAEVLAAGEHQYQMAISLSAASAWRNEILGPLLESRGIPAYYAPHIKPGEADPVRRQKKAKHAAELFQMDVLTQDEARVAAGYQPLTEEQKTEKQRKEKEEDTDKPGSEPEERHEDRSEDRSK